MSRLAILGMLGFGLAATGCESSVVGATCQSDFTICDGECVNLEADFRNCGACGHRCPGFACYHGVCGVAKDAGTGGGGSGGRGGGSSRGPQGGGSVEIGWNRDGGALDGAVDRDAGMLGCRLGELECSGVCVDPASDPAHCGGCGQACVGEEVCSAGQCAAACEGELRACRGRCYDLRDDPDHCGGCDGRCASGICEEARCADAIAGQLAVIGHDFTDANGAMRRIAGNAVFLARGAPVRVLSYQGAASEASVRGVEAAIEFARAEIGRSWQKIEAEEASVPMQLMAADVFLIHAQAGADDATLSRLGRRWGTATTEFLARGGTVVLFETPSMRNGGTFRVLEPARIFAAFGRFEIPVQTLTVQTPGSGVAVRVPDRYMSAKSSVRFEGLTTPATSIVVDNDGEAVVLQRVVVP